MLPKTNCATCNKVRTAINPALRFMGLPTLPVANTVNASQPATQQAVNPAWPRRKD